MLIHRPPIHYRIRLRGGLDPERAAWFPELSIAADPDGNSLLRGTLPDQAAMLGILLRAHNLNLEIVAVEKE